MSNVRWVASLVFCAFVFNASTSHADLIDRGGGLIYDDVLDVTWLQDASYAYTSGYSPFGRLTWDDATQWVSSLSYVDEARNTTWDDWRLPTTVNALSSVGFDTTGQSSELAYMYYVNLGYPANPGDQSSPSPTSDNYNPFINLLYRSYWSGTLWESEAHAWYIHLHFGEQGLTGRYGDSMNVWAVRDGDVGLPTAVPEPTTLGLLGLGLVGAMWGRPKRT